MDKKPNKAVVLLAAGACIAAILFFNYQLFMLIVEGFKKLFGIN